MLSLILTFLVGAGSVPDFSRNSVADVHAKKKAVESVSLGTSLNLSLDYRVVHTIPNNVAHEFWLCLHWYFSTAERAAEPLSTNDAHMDMI